MTAKTVPQVNAPVAKLADITGEFDAVVADDPGRVSHARVLVRDGRNRVAAITAKAGAPSDPHLHPDFNEWWVILGGEVQYGIGDYPPFIARSGDIVIAPAGYRHDIQPKKGDHCVRVVVGPETSNHDLKGVEPRAVLPLVEPDPPNRIHTSFEYMMERHDMSKPWSEEVLLDQRNRANMIHTLPGQSSRAHWHPDMDEWWVVLKGELEWTVGGNEKFLARKGDITFVEAGYSHGIRTVGDETSIRLAVTLPDVQHIFLDDPAAERPPKG